MSRSIATNRSVSISLRASIFLVTVFLGGVTFSWMAHSYLTSPDSDVGATADPRIRDTTKVYFGSASRFSKPAVIVRKDVYDKIPSYQRIQSEGLRRSDARYHLLLEKTSKAFRSAVKRAARTNGRDLVIETGAITPPADGGKHLDLTAATIAEIKKP